MTTIFESWLGPYARQRHSFFPGQEPVEVLSREPLSLWLLLEVRVANDGAVPLNWRVFRVDDGKIGIIADGLRLGYRVQKDDEPSYIIGDASLFVEDMTDRFERERIVETARRVGML